MLKFTTLALYFLVTLALSACASGGGTGEKPAAKEARQQPQMEQKSDAGGWQSEWEKTLAEARKEGTINISVWGGPRIRERVGKAFKEKYGIEIAWTPGGGLEIAEKVIRERRAGLYLADMSISGTGTFVTVLKPAGVLQPMEPELILPEVKDLKAWYAGKLPFMDKEKLIFFINNFPNPPVLINTEMVRKDEIQSYSDLLAPRWKSNIAWTDPTMPGSGSQTAFVVGAAIMGWDFLREIAKQDPKFHRDRRQVVDWVAKGKYPIGIGTDRATILEYVEAGSPLKQITPREGTYLSSGGANIVIFSKAPHANARRVFVNWLLSREGMSTWSKADGYLTSRIDIPTDHIDPDDLFKPGVKYFNTTDEEWDMGRPARFEKIKEIFGHLLR